MSKINIGATTLLFIPIFITYVPGLGFITSANPFNLFELPSVPLGGILLPFIAIFSLRVRTLVMLSMAIIVTAIYGVFLWQFSGLYRQFFYVVSLSIAMTAYYLGSTTFKNTQGLGTIRILKNILIGIVLVKLIFDLASGSLMTDFFIHPKLSIYNFYDYFPVVYFFLFTMSLELFFRTGRSWHILGIVLGLLVFLTWSRLFQLAVIFSLIYYVCQIYLINKNTQITLTIASVLMLTFFVALFIDLNEINDASLHERFKHWEEFFSSVSAIDFIFPFLNPYRQELKSGTFHNEILDIFSYFGAGVFILFLFFHNVVSVKDRSARRVITIIITIFILGSVIQNNITQFYSCILLFFSLGALSAPTDKGKEMVGY